MVVPRGNNQLIFSNESGDQWPLLLKDLREVGQLDAFRREPGSKRSPTNLIRPSANSPTSTAPGTCMSRSMVRITSTSGLMTASMWGAPGLKASWKGAKPAPRSLPPLLSLVVFHRHAYQHRTWVLNQTVTFIGIQWDRIKG